MLSHWSGGKSGHPGERRSFLTIRVESVAQLSRRSSHCWTSGPSLARRTAEVPFQGKSSSLTQALWRFLDPSSIFSDSKSTECCLLAFLGLDEMVMNSISGSEHYAVLICYQQQPDLDLDPNGAVMKYSGIRES
jgi:hypothetical protein